MRSLTCAAFAIAVVAIFVSSTQAAVALFDDFNNNDPAVGGPGSVNGGFEFESNNGNGSFTEPVGTNLRIAANTATSNNAGGVSTNSFDPTAAGVKSFTTTWVITSFDDPAFNGLNLTLQNNAAFFSDAAGRPNLLFRFDENDDSTFHLIAHDGTTAVELTSDPITLSEALDGFTLTATLTPTGYAYTSTGLASLADAAGSWTPTHNYSTLFDSTTHVGAFIQKTGAGGNTTPRVLLVDSITVSVALTPEPSSVLLALLGMVSLGFCRRCGKHR